MTRILTIIAVLFCMMACNSGTPKGGTKEPPTPKEETKVPTKEQYEKYMQELGPLKDKLGPVFMQHTKIENGKCVLDIDRDGFIELGLPSIAYDVALYNVWEINTTLDGLDKEVREQTLQQLTEQFNAYHK